MLAVLMSMKPEWWEKILGGEKRWKSERHTRKMKGLNGP